MEKVQSRKRAEQPGLQEEHQGEINRNALFDFPRRQHCHRHDNGREHEHQQAKTIDTEVVLRGESRYPGILLFKLEFARGGFELMP